MTPEDLLRDLSSQLGLTFEPQDWGIVNADPARLEEFIRCYESPKLAPSQRLELGELILASGNERLLTAEAAPAADDPAIELLVRFLRRHRGEQAAHLDYWSRLEPARDYPLAALLRARVLA